MFIAPMSETMTATCSSEFGSSEPISATAADAVECSQCGVSDEPVRKTRPRRMGRNRKIRLRTLNPYITCGLCHGYLIDATSITECLHSCKYQSSFNSSCTGKNAMRKCLTFVI